MGVHKKPESYYKSLEGKRFNKQTKYLCKCSCGKKQKLFSQSIFASVRRNATGCKKCHSVNRSYSPKRNLIGKTFGQWTVLSFAGMKKGKRQGNSSWLCKCSCGKEKQILEANLRNGMSKSCGCLIVKAATTHGDSKTHFFKTFRNLHLNHKTILPERWGKYSSFKEDMHEGYLLFKKDHSNKTPRLRRFDYRKPFSKENCYWGKNIQNTGNYRYYELSDGTKLSLQDILVKAGITRQAFHKRLKTHSIDEAIQPLKISKKLQQFHRSVRKRVVREKRKLALDKGV